MASLFWFFLAIYVAIFIGYLLLRKQGGSALNYLMALLAIVPLFASHYWHAFIASFATALLMVVVESALEKRRGGHGAAVGMIVILLGILFISILLHVIQRASGWLLGLEPIKLLGENWSAMELALYLIAVAAAVNFGVKSRLAKDEKNQKGFYEMQVLPLFMLALLPAFSPVYWLAFALSLLLALTIYGLSYLILGSHSQATNVRRLMLKFYLAMTLVGAAMELARTLAA
ncbi:hypothetical protein [Gallaecimonas mangrovi]|uniref:hypothetical protein n=1 Tax=Gallaecimonas mangrovi TaxID=2291597 RepID=UPI000E203CA2|nr:hypothetical protein [Gallaecimonas mangrovi]